MRSKNKGNDMRSSLLSKPKVNREHFIRHKEIDQNLISELSVALDNLDIEKMKTTIKEISKTHPRISDIPAMLGISRPGYYKMLSPNGNPEFITILRLLNLFDIKLQVEARK
jgi:DNA-binding phage protein